MLVEKLGFNTTENAVSHDKVEEGYKIETTSENLELDYWASSMCSEVDDSLVGEDAFDD